MTPKRARFVTEYMLDGNGTAAAVRSGYARAGAHVTASRLLRDPKVAAALQTRQQATAQRLQLDRAKVLAEIREAIDLARVQGNPMAMIAGWREIAKMCGFYAPEVRKVELSAEARGRLGRLEGMSDAELLAIAGGDATG